MEHHRQLPGRGWPGLARDWLGRYRPPSTPHHPARDRAAAALAAPGRPVSPPSSAARSAPSASPWKTSATSSAFQDHPGRLPYYEEALSLCQQISARTDEADLAGTLGNTYQNIPGVRDLGQAEHWYQHSLTHRPDGDTLGRAGAPVGLGNGRPTSGST